MPEVDDELRINVGKLCKTSEKLLLETERLRRDVVRLYGRIEPFEDEKVLDDFSFENTNLKSLPEAVDAIAKSRTRIENIERDVSLMKARLEQLLVDGWSRDEMKPWLKG